MAKAAKMRRKDMTPVQRAIFSRERGIQRMRDNIKQIREQANKDISAVEVRIAEKQVLLDALKRGQLGAKS